MLSERLPIKKKLEDKLAKLTLETQDIAGNQVEPPECPPDPQDIAGNQMDAIKERLIAKEEPDEEVKVVKKKVGKKKSQKTDYAAFGVSGQLSQR